MGEENKQEPKKEEKEDDTTKKEKKEEEEKTDQEIVLKVDMHCEACARKVARALKGFEGVSDVTADYKASRVVVKGGNAADPVKLCQRLQKKSRRKVEIISPLPKPPPPPPPEEEGKEDPNKVQQQQPKQEVIQPPAVVTIVLKVRMHCEACAQALQKKIGKVKGVESVTADVANNQVTVKGVLDPEKLVKDIYKKTGKQASIVKDEEKKAEEKKEEEKKEEKKAEEEEEKKQVSKEGEDDDKKSEVKKNEYLPPKYYMDHAYNYYGPQMFSDENPNACSVM